MKNAEYQGSLSCPQRDSAEHKGYAGAQSVGSQEGKEQGGADSVSYTHSESPVRRALRSFSSVTLSFPVSADSARGVGRFQRGREGDGVGVSTGSGMLPGLSLIHI